MNVLCVIPARAGSKRIPMKNWQQVDGLTLIDHATACVPTEYSWCISTDHMPTAVQSHGILRPVELSGDSVDIADVVQHATQVMEESEGLQYDYVVTLQPAVMARTAAIVRGLVEAVHEHRAKGGLTMAETVPWQWTTGRYVPDGPLNAFRSWNTMEYPRSQDCGDHFAEVNAVQVTTRNVAVIGRRWMEPLVIAPMPSWSVALDIDTPEELEAVRELWPVVRHRLRGHTPDYRIAEAVR